MPAITFDQKSLSIGGRRHQIVGARFEYALCPPNEWAERIIALKQHGFNTILTSCPWLLHEPNQGVFRSEGTVDVAAFLALAHAHGMRVIVRVGPVVGAPFDGGGLPAWLGSNEDVRVREHDPAFIGLVSTYFKDLLPLIADAQADRDSGGALIAVQVEDGWWCGATEHGHEYLSAMIRLVREGGVTVPLLMSNGFWQHLDEPIEMWSGWDNLTANLRQVNHVQSSKPRIAYIKPPLRTETDRPEAALRIADVLATGGHAILDHTVEPVGPLVCASNGGVIGSMVLDARGDSQAGAGMIKRISSFASHFSGLLCDQDPAVQPVTLDLNQSPDGVGPAVIGTLGTQGNVVWIFRGDGPGTCSVLLANGVRMPISFGDSAVSWIVLDASVNGTARLDYVNIPPYAILKKRVLVLHGAAGSSVYLSIDDAPGEFTVPPVVRGGGAPFIVEHGALTVVICNQQQIDASIMVDDAFLFGINRVSTEGAMYGAPSVTDPLRIDGDGEATPIKATPRPRLRKRALGAWEVFDEPDPRTPDHPRAVKIDRHVSLASVGDPCDYGWFSAAWTSHSNTPRDLRFLGGLREAKVWVDGTPEDGSSCGAVSIQAPKGEHVIALLARHTPLEGRCPSQRGDKPGELVHVKPLAGTRLRTQRIEPADPFTVRRFLQGAGEGEQTADRARVASFTHRRNTRLVVEITGPSGLLLLNDQPIAWHDGEGLQLTMTPRQTDGFKRGTNTIALAPLEWSEVDLALSSIKVFEVVETVVAEDAWRFRRWEQPDLRIGRWEDARASQSSGAQPRWYRSTFRGHADRGVARLSLGTLTRGRVWLDGVPVGSYGEANGSSRRSIVVPLPERNTDLARERTLLVFDEDGSDPFGVSLSA